MAATHWDPALPGLKLLPASSFQEGVYLTGQAAGGRTEAELRDDLGRPVAGPPSSPILESAAPLSAFTSLLPAQPTLTHKLSSVHLFWAGSGLGVATLWMGRRTEAGPALVLVPSQSEQSSASAVQRRMGGMLRPLNDFRAPACGREAGMARCPRAHLLPVRWYRAGAPMYSPPDSEIHPPELLASKSEASGGCGLGGL